MVLLLHSFIDAQDFLNELKKEKVPLIPHNLASAQQLLGNVIQLLLLVGEQERLDAGGEDVILEAELPTGLVNLGVAVQLVALLADAIQAGELAAVVRAHAADAAEGLLREQVIAAARGGQQIATGDDGGGHQEDDGQHGHQEDGAREELLESGEIAEVK
ncbi:hypothetical protein TYRP_004008 [Tyrophagus putrescentiae]|nr:hypothetical protein TYRP_004008 [Tyrophagus putrescentiae]